MTEHRQARNSSEAYWSLNPFEIVGPGDPWFADLERLVPREHYGVAHKLKRKLAAAPGRPEFVHVGLLGHRGTGKSTLARSALAELSGDGLMPVRIDTLAVLDVGDFVFSDLVLVVAESIIRQLLEVGLEVANEQLEAVRDWFAEEVLIQSHRDQILGSLDVSAEGGLSLPFVAAFAAKLSGALKSDNEYRREIRRRAERNPAELVRRVNLLLDAVHQALAPRRAKLCVVFDDLEKTDPKLVDRAVLERAGEIRQLRANALLFFNPTNEYSPYSTRVSHAFECINVPVLPVRFPGDPPDRVRPEALAAIERLLSRRLVLDGVFERAEDCVRALAFWSGGHVRDVLAIARTAAENVEPAKVGAADIDKAGRALGRRLITSLRPEDFARAVEIHRTHKILDTDQDRRMLKNSCVLPYNGTEWWDVHPGVRADETFIALLSERV